MTPVYDHINGYYGSRALVSSPAMKLPVMYDELTWQEKIRVRIAYIQQQDGKCTYCGEPLHSPASKKVLGTWVNGKLFPPGFWNSPIHLHHSHDTGLTIGVVHNRCNAVLWQYHKE